VLAASLPVDANQCSSKLDRLVPASAASSTLVGS